MLHFPAIICHALPAAGIAYMVRGESPDFPLDLHSQHKIIYLF